MATLTVKYRALLAVFILGISTATVYSQTEELHIWEVNWSRDGKYIATILFTGRKSASNEIVKVYDAETLQELGTIIEEENTAYIDHIALSPNGNLLAISKTPHTRSVPIVEVWDISVNPFQQLYLYNLVDRASEAYLAWHPDSTELAIDTQFEITILGGVSGQLQQTLVRENGGEIYTHKIAWSPDGEWFLAAGADGYLWNLSSLLSPAVIFTGEGLYEAAWSPNSTRFAARFGEVVEIWTINPLEPIASFDSEIESSAGLQWAGNTIAVHHNTIEGSFINIWNAETLDLIRVIPLAEVISDFALSPDGSQIVYGISDGSIKMFEIFDASLE